MSFCHKYILINHVYFHSTILQNGSEIFVMDIIDEVSSDILTNALRNISPEDKVGYITV